MATTPEAQRRAMILTFWKRHGLQATRDAFAVSRSTLFEWQQRLKSGRKRLRALEPRSRRPHRLRVMTTPNAVIDRIRTLREQFPHYGKEKLYVLLKEQDVTVSSSTIGKIIKRWNLPHAPRMYVARRKRKMKPRLPKGNDPKKPGDLISMDTIVLQERGEKKFIVTALDHATRMAMARVYERLSSKSARDLLQRMQLSLGLPITAVLTDNGSEFYACYEQACKALEAAHYWTYPRSPKMNARTERFNRTIQEEVRFPAFDATIQQWNERLGLWLVEYNFYRPHYALDYRRPIDEYLSALTSTPAESRMLGTHTPPCIQTHSLL